MVRFLLEASYRNPRPEVMEGSARRMDEKWIDHVNVDGLSAVMSALLYGQLFVVSYLLSQGALENYTSAFNPPPPVRSHRALDLLAPHSLACRSMIFTRL